MSKLLAFLNGMREFRSDFTTNYDHVETDEGDALQEAYDLGREWAHRLTLRRYDNTAI